MLQGISATFTCTICHHTHLKQMFRPSCILKRLNRIKRLLPPRQLQYSTNTCKIVYQIIGKNFFNYLHLQIMNKRSYLLSRYDINYLRPFLVSFIFKLLKFKLVVVLYVRLFFDSYSIQFSVCQQYEQQKAAVYSINITISIMTSSSSSNRRKKKQLLHVMLPFIYFFAVMARLDAVIVSVDVFLTSTGVTSSYYVASIYSLYLNRKIRWHYLNLNRNTAIDGQGQCMLAEPTIIRWELTDLPERKFQNNVQ